MSDSKSWRVYLAEAADGSLYAGISPDVEQRIASHNQGRGSRYLRSRLPVRLVYKCEVGHKSLAGQVEYRLKRLTRQQKCHLVAKQPCKDVLLEFLDIRGT